MAVVLRATWIAKPGSEDVVRAALTELAPLSRSESGNLHYTVYQNDSEPLVFHIFEVYADEAAVAAHAESPHFRQWAIEKAIPQLDERKREFFETLDV